MRFFISAARRFPIVSQCWLKATVRASAAQVFADGFVRQPRTRAGISINPLRDARSGRIWTAPTEHLGTPALAGSEAEVASTAAGRQLVVRSESGGTVGKTLAWWKGAPQSHSAAIKRLRETADELDDALLDPLVRCRHRHCLCVPRLRAVRARTCLDHLGSRARGGRPRSACELDPAKAVITSSVGCVTRSQCDHDDARVHLRALQTPCGASIRRPPLLARGSSLPTARDFPCGLLPKPE